MLKGLAISPGFALGRVYCLKHFQLENIESVPVDASEIDAEIDRFKNALEVSRREIRQLLELPQIKSSHEISNIFQAHLTLIDDPDLHKEVSKRVGESLCDVQSVVSNVIKDYSKFFRNLPDPQFQSKAIDIMDVGKRIIKNCLKRKSRSINLNDSDEAVIIFAEDLTPSEIVSFNPDKVLGLAIERGTPTSHASILARSMGIPTLIQVKDLMQKSRTGTYAILDGVQAKVIISPSQQTRDHYQLELENFAQRQKKITEQLSEPAVTTDGITISLMANIGQPSDVESVVTSQADGIGLYRTEFAYMTRRSFPTEKELFDTYSSVITRLTDKNVAIRTIDIGGDKISHLLGDTVERNPELGWRAVRMSLDCEEVFRTQLRAILRASGKASLGLVKVLFPMISNLSELRRAKALLAAEHESLIQSGAAVPESIQVGIMIEIPSAALMADKFAREVDFFSIGSNDLVQYTLAVDRTNSKVSHLYQPANPAVINLIHQVIKVGKLHNVEVSLCGEMAGDSRYTILLLGLGLRNLSMNAILIPTIKQIVRNVSFADAEKLIQPLLAMDTAEEIELALTKLNSKLNIL